MCGGGSSRAYGRGLGIVNARLRQAPVLLAVLLLTLLVLAGSTQAQDARPRVLVLGDSLTAGFGLPQEQGFTARLQGWLQRAGLDVAVVNGGVSGDTSAGGLARLDWTLGAKPPEFAVVELGANDALRGLSPSALYGNLDKIVGRLQARRVKVMIAGMYAPRNFGREYDDEFDAVYPRLAKERGVPLYPFFLEGVAGNPALNQPDGIHPNAQGVDVIVERIGPMIASLIRGG